MSHYDEYFNAQLDRGCDGAGSLCMTERNQRGCGIGGFLGGLYRLVLPLFKKGTREFGKEAMRTGFNVASDVAQVKLPLRHSLETRLRESGQDLKRKAEEKLDQLLDEGRYKRLRERDDVHSLSDSDSDHTRLASYGIALWYFGNIPADQGIPPRNM
ncbi:hypothetical protein QAD02_008108 [Eretmocerus hayati]|uniref:Uncharacterized protein n=1 Tax=Eretmocerus hayati TaxID=131215 RepID=A0ACC2N6W7_9HYME|nr:hypothetical protein QAD02_008108 [Eretmocerus hayati]